MSDTPHEALPLPGPQGSLPTPGPHAPPPGQLAPPDESSLTGMWRADDGGVYFLRQIDDVLWWVGLSQGDALYPGLHFCNVFHAKVTGQIVTGEWSDVPRGTTSNRGTMTLTFVDGNPQLLLRKPETGDGFSGSRWWRPASSPWPVVSAGYLFPGTLKNVVKNGHVHEKSSLADNLEIHKDSVTVFGTTTRTGTHTNLPVTVNYPSDQGRSYSDFICLNDPSFFGVGDQPDGDVTFDFLIDRDQVSQRQPNFLAGVNSPARADIVTKMAGSIEGEIIMYGRGADCDDDAKETSPPLFPGWAEDTGNSVLFNGRPIRVASGVGSSERSFLTELSYGDPVRVTGALVFDTGHDGWPLEVHPVYSVDKITATFSRDLSGVWADDVGNTYYLRHDLADNTVWYAGISPLGDVAFGQVFRGTFNPAPVVTEASAIPEGVGVPVLPWNTLTGSVAAISLGFGISPSFESSRTQLGDTGPMTFGLSSVRLVGRDVPAFTMGDFMLIKLYDA